MQEERNISIDFYLRIMNFVVGFTGYNPNELKQYLM